MTRASTKLAAKLDQQLVLEDLRDALRPSSFGWSRSVRRALGFGLVDLCMRLHISQPAATKLEQREMEGTITVQKLRMLAEAMDCDLVYGFVPRTSFIEMAEKEERKAQVDRDRRGRARSSTKAD